MRALVIATAGIAVFGLAVCGPVYAGTVTRTAGTITYQADAATGAAEAVSLGVDAATIFVSSDRGVTSSICTQVSPERVDCPPTPAIVVNLLGFSDLLTTDTLGAVATVEAHGGGGDDRLNGALGVDRLFGDSGKDQLDGKAGSDVLDGGGDDDAIVGGPGEDQIAGGDGGDAIEARDGAVDTIDCGAGIDTALADIGDAMTNCEAGVDFDGDGFSGNADCAPGDPAIRPGVPEVPANAIDENCDGVAAPALADIAIFSTSPKILRVSRTGRFTYTFVATPGRKGNVKLRSTRSIRVGAKKRRLTLAAKTFTAPASGRVRQAFRLSAANLRALKRVSSLQFEVRVTVGGKTFTTKLKLRPPNTTKR